MNEKFDEEKCDGEVDDILQSILNHIQICPAVFQSQQIGDPDLTGDEKKSISAYILMNKPLEFLTKFGKFLKAHHLNHILKKYGTSNDVRYYVNKLMLCVDERYKNQLKRNRRYEAMKRMEASGNYFSDAEMEKREPLLYYQMVGQYLNDFEKQKKHEEADKNIYQSFSNFLLHELEKEELNELLIAEQNEENKFHFNELNNSDQTEPSDQGTKHLSTSTKWGADWEDEEYLKEVKNSKSFEIYTPPQIESQEKALLYEEFKSTMRNKFLSGEDSNIDYSDIDSNSEYDCLEIRAQDEEEKYFDEETSDDSYNCTDTGIEDY